MRGTGQKSYYRKGLRTARRKNTTSPTVLLTNARLQTFDGHRRTASENEGELTARTRVGKFAA